MASPPHGVDVATSIAGITGVIIACAGRSFEDWTTALGGSVVTRSPGDCWLPAMVRRLNAEERERPDLALGLILLEQNAYSEVEFDREKWIDLFGKKRIGVEGI